MNYNKLKCLVFIFVSILNKVAPVLYEGDACSDGEQKGVCKLLNACTPLMDEIRKAGSPMPRAIVMKLRRLHCSFAGYNSEEPVVCCASSSVNPIPDSVEKGDVNTTLKNEDRSGSNDNTTGNPNDDFRIPPDVTKHPNLKLLPTSCGIRGDTDKVFGGKPSKLFEFPWMALIVLNTIRGLEKSCGATVISENYVLTAAHCVSFLGKKTVQHVVLGEYDTTTDPDCITTLEDGSSFEDCTPGIMNATIESVTSHPGYTPGTLVDDIALIRLSEPVDLSGDSIKPICLPTTPMLQQENMVGTKAEVAGWGAMDNGYFSTLLLHAAIPIIKNDDCDNTYKIKLKETQICAGGIDNKDSCAGDSGGPLISPGATFYGKRYIQRGIVSTGSRLCGITGRPGVYTNVAYYMDWILNQMTQ